MSVQKIFLYAILMVVVASCTTKKELLMEPVKDLNALWRIQNVTRNSVDITQFIDSAGFRLMLSGDSSYMLEGNNIPFLVDAGEGKWATNDPQYPYRITFIPKDSTVTFNGSIETPASKGERTLSISFSPGCRSNTYVYTFEKVK